LYIFDLADSLLIMIRASRVYQVAVSLCAGVVGCMILVLFFTALMPVVSLSKLMPWIIGFNSAVTGYMLLDKTRNGLKYKRLAALCSGGLVVILACGIIFFLAPSIFDFLTVTVAQLVLWLFIGIVFGGLGGLLAIKYLDLNK